MKKTIISIILIAVAGIALQFKLNTDLMMTAFAVTAGWFVFGKISLCYRFFQGHGVGLVNKKALATLIVMLVIIGSIIGGLIYSAYNMFDFVDSAAANIKHLSLLMAVGYVVAIAYWPLYAKQAYYYGSEHDARAELEEKGYGDIIEQKIATLKKTGYLPKS